ncbi:hypothetical protein BOX15_Mlig009548g1, partial [Macrostomum lignano]
SKSALASTDSEMNFAGILLAALLLCVTAAAAQPPPGPHRLLRCPAEFAALVEPLPDDPNLQPVLTTGPGVRLQTVRFLRDSELRLDSAGRLWLNVGASSRSAGSRFSGPHHLECQNDRKTVSFVLYIRLRTESLANPVTTAPHNSSEAAAEDIGGLRPRELVLAGTALLLLLACLCLTAALVVVSTRRTCCWQYKQKKIFVPPTGLKSGHQQLLGKSLGEFHEVTDV